MRKIGKIMDVNLYKQAAATGQQALVEKLVQTKVAMLREILAEEEGKAGAALNRKVANAMIEVACENFPAQEMLTRDITSAKKVAAALLTNIFLDTHKHLGDAMYDIRKTAELQLRKRAGTVTDSATKQYIDNFEVGESTFAEGSEEAGDVMDTIANLYTDGENPNAAEAGAGIASVKDGKQVDPITGVMLSTEGALQDTNRVEKTAMSVLGQIQKIAQAIAKKAGVETTDIPEKGDASDWKGTAQEAVDKNQAKTIEQNPSTDDNATVEMGDAMDAMALETELTELLDASGASKKDQTNSVTAVAPVNKTASAHRAPGVKIDNAYINSLLHK